MTRTTFRTSRALYGLALITVATLTACTGTPAPDPTSSPSLTPSPTHPPTPSPTPSMDPAVAEATAAILEAYDGYWTAKVSYLAAPNDDEPAELRQFAVDKALAAAREAARLFQENGIVARGEPVLAPTVTDVKFEGEPTAAISDCVDVSGWQPIYVDGGGSAAAPGQPDRQLTQSEAIFYDGRWVIRDSVVLRDRTC